MATIRKRGTADRCCEGLIIRIPGHSVIGRAGNFENTTIIHTNPRSRPSGVPGVDLREPRKTIDCSDWNMNLDPEVFSRTPHVLEHAMFCF